MSTRIFLFLVFILLQQQVFAQNLVSDSLLLEDLKHINTESDIDSAIEQTLKIYEKAQAIEYPRSLRKSLQQLSHLYLQDKNTIPALRYGLEYLSVLQDSSSLQVSLANEHIGDIYYSEEIYSASLSYYLKSIQEHNYHRNKIGLIEKIAGAFLLNQQLDSAAVYFEKARNIHQVNSNYAGQLRSLQHLAKINDLNGNCLLALQGYQKIEELINKQGSHKEIATVYNNIGYQYHCLEDPKNAIHYFELSLENIGKQTGLSKITLYTNIGIAYFNNQEFSKATENIKLALEMAYANKDAVQICTLENLLAKIFYEQGELYVALLHNDIALNKSESKELHEILTGVYLTEANIYERLYEYDKALSFYQKHLQLRDSLLLAERIKQEKVLQHKFALERSEKEIKLLLVNKKVQDLALEQLTLERNNLELAANQKENEIALLRREQQIRDERLRIDELQALKAQQELSLTRQRLLASQKDGQILALEQKEAQQALEISRREAEEQVAEQEILLLNNEKNLQQLELDKQASFRQFTNWLLVALSIILFLILGGYLFARKTNKQLEFQKEAIEIQKSELESEKTKSEQLLLNILPKEVANDLINTGSTQPQHYEKVSVLFADFENFTSLAEKMSPQQLIEELNACFIAFDEIGSRHCLEKIKTIGDAYMSAGGIPIANNSHAEDTIKAALEMMDFIDNRYQEKLKNNLPYWKMRIGIHTGPVVAGVVGSNKFAYDIWGDTVNIASRMESNSQAGRINISKQTLEELPANYQCENRGKLAMKNKDDAEMFFVTKVV